MGITAHLMSNESRKLKIFPLRQITRRIYDILNEYTVKQFWVQGNLVVSAGAGIRGGHFYAELVDYEQGKQIAKLRVTIWKSQLNKIIKKLKAAGVENPLNNNSEVCMLASIRYHELYGVGLQIFDVDPYFGEDEIERKRREIIETLTKEGLLKKNTLLPLPSVPLRIGLISSNESAAFKDFSQTLFSSHYSFKIFFAPAQMQGELAEESVLRSIKKLQEFPLDVLCIVRGGGSTLDLAWLDNLKIAKSIAQSSLPILVGIGHEIDRGVLDVVANRSYKTPTAVAEGLVQILSDQELNMDNSLYRLKDGVERTLVLHQRGLKTWVGYLSRSMPAYLSKEIAEFKNMENRVEHSFKTFTKQIESDLQLISNQVKDSIFHHIRRGQEILNHWDQKLKEAGYKIVFEKERLKNGSAQLGHKLKMFFRVEHGSLLALLKRFNMARFLTPITIERNNLRQWSRILKSNDPQSILNRGYSISKRKQGGVIKNPKELKKGEKIVTQVAEGQFESEVVPN